MIISTVQPAGALTRLGQVCDGKSQSHAHGLSMASESVLDHCLGSSYSAVVHHYYFNARGRDCSFADNNGVDLAHPQAAYDHAVQIIRDLASKPEELWSYADWTMEIVDETGRIVLTVLFLEARQPASGRA